MASFDFQEQDLVDNLRIVNGTDAADYLRTSSLRQASVEARMKSGNDKIVVKGGLKNFVNANAGDDEIYLQPEAGGGNYLGGDGDDVIRYSSMPFEHANYINGNKGNDLIVGESDAFAFVRGGQGDDYITGNGVFYGDQGADTFAPPRSGYAVVKDFNPFEDKIEINGSRGELVITPSSTMTPGITLSQPLNDITMFVEGVLSADQLNIVYL